MKNIKFARLKKSTLSEEVEHSIKDLISAGRLQPGDKLPTEKELANQFGVSLVTIRGALRALESLDMITKKRGKTGGAVVLGIQPDPLKKALWESYSSGRLSLKHVTQMREIIEPRNARIAANNIGAEMLERIGANIQSCEMILNRSGSEFTEHNYFSFEEKNVEYHKLIAEISGNPLLIFTVDYLVNALLAYKRRILTPNPDFSAISINEHKAIYSSLKESRAVDAEHFMQLHVKRVAEYLDQLNSRL